MRRIATATAVAALAAFAYEWLSTGSGDWKLVALAGLVLTLTDVFATILGMAGTALSRIFHGSAITPDRAEGLVGRVRAKYPDAPELQGVDRLA